MTANRAAIILTSRRSMADERDSMFAVVKAFEKELGLTAGFLEALLNDGDEWSFVIKLHALFEAALTDLLTAGVGREELREHFAALTMGDSRRGKLTLAARLHLLDPRRVTFLQALGRIRNHFAHDVKHAGKRIEDYAQTLKPEHQKQLWQALIQAFTIEPTIIDFDGQTVLANDFARKRPRFAIWISALSTLALAYHARSFDQETREKLFAALSSLKPSNPSPGTQDSQ